MIRAPKQRLHGWLVLDKPLGPSSTQALGKVRHLLNAEKAGHGGTLDPLASGLLPIALGEATKTIAFVMDGQKTYRFTVQWGAETNTDDLEGERTALSPLFYIHENNILPVNLTTIEMRLAVEKVLPQFIGQVLQTPPAYSAILVNGQRAYALARAGEEVVLEPRLIKIDSAKIIDWPTPSQTTFEVTCGKGTYVRSIAKDMGRATGFLGHVVMLRRTGVGPFTEEHMISLEKLAEIVHRPPSENSLSALLRPIETVLDGIPALAVMDPDAQRLRQGQMVLLPGSLSLDAAEVVLVNHDGRPLGLCSIAGGFLKPKRLFNL